MLIERVITEPLKRLASGEGRTAMEVTEEVACWICTPFVLSSLEEE